jgi:hypothetical protein
MQFSTYSEPSFSPEIFTSRIPFPITVAGEQFEIKSELFDINSNLVYSDLRTIALFDPSGATLVPTTTSPGTVSQTVTSTNVTAIGDPVNVICPLRAPDGWFLINNKKVPYYN